MRDETELLIDIPLVPDPDADEEMGPTDAEAIADEDLQGSRLLLVRRTVKPIQIDGESGGIVEFLCTFQPAFGSRFQWASLTLRLNVPEQIKIIDMAPRSVKDQEPVQFTFDDKGKIGLKHNIANANLETEIKKTFAVYECTVQGSGIGTNLARWDFRENSHRQDGLGVEHPLVITLSTTGRITGSVNVNARLIRPGLSGKLTTIRDMILGYPKRSYEIEFEIQNESTSRWSPYFFLNR